MNKNLTVTLFIFLVLFTQACSVSNNAKDEIEVELITDRAILDPIVTVTNRPIDLSTTVSKSASGQVFNVPTLVERYALSPIEVTVNGISIPLSANDIYNEGGNSFGHYLTLTYHSRGEDYAGGVHYFDTPGGYVDLQLTNSRVDWNTSHMWRVGTQTSREMVIAGDTRLGPVVHRLQWENPQQGPAEEFIAGDSLAVSRNEYAVMPGASANHITRMNGQLVLSTGNEDSAAGIFLLNDSGDQILDRHTITGIKGLYPVDNSTLVALRDNGVNNATLLVYDMSNNDLSSFRTITLSAPISPRFGKNDVFAVGQKVYLSLGENGMTVYDLSDDSESVYDNFNGPVNSVFVDDLYVYVAAGGSVYFMQEDNISGELVIVSTMDKAAIAGDEDPSLVSVNEITSGIGDFFTLDEQGNRITRNINNQRFIAIAAGRLGVRLYFVN